MLQKSARFIFALVLALSLCPTLAFADDSSRSQGSGNPLADLFFSVVGYEGDDEVQEQEATGTLYENELKAPADIDASKLEGGLLVGASKKLFYFPQVNAGTEESPVYAITNCLSYDTGSGSWAEVGLPQSWFVYGSVAVFDGALVFFGATDSSSETPSYSNLSECVYSYDPGQGSEAAWSGDGEFSSANVPVGASVVNNGGVLQAVGGIQGSSLSTAVSTYEPSEGVVGSVGSLSYGAACPKAIPYSGALYVYSFGSSLAEVQAGTGSAHLQLFKDGSSSDITSGLPYLSSDVETRAARYGCISSAVGGAVIAGPLAESGPVDTYVMGWDSESFTAYARRAADGQLLGTASCVYLDKLYAIGAKQPSSDGDPALSFRSTTMADAALLSGNNGVWRQGSDQNLPFTYFPDFGRFGGTVSVDGTELSLGRDFEASAGSTVVQLHPAFLSTLSLGSHTIHVYFDDNLTDVSASFTVETTASSIEEGYTRPASLAMTGDAVPVVGVVAVACIAAAVAAFVALRKRSSR